MKLRSVELGLPDPEAATEFMVDIWGAALAERRGDTFYLRGSGSFPYLLSLEKADGEFVRSTTFVCDEAELVTVRKRSTAAVRPVRDVVSSDPGGGRGVIVELPEGELWRFLVDATEVAPIEGRDLPVKLTHVVFNSIDAEASGHAVEDLLNFRVSDRTKGMVFVRCNDSHHSVAFARAGFASLNHIAFEMKDIDAVMRGIGRMRDAGQPPAWGPGRHGPGANVYAYYVSPFGPVIEFSTAVDKVADDHKVGAPSDWTWPSNRIDQWGVSDKDFDSLRAAEERFRFLRDEVADPVQT
ncbi:catechol 2,3-dioxygenase-like lactoylglutathione lyase family enzyme [Novosphingobium chloroacetimidivorans]|uniref:Catechol 2,3-dioxygenase-like lactoylglutathione lyase family enzyme n=1 Tax=Novosphingobium chloroacetimidivorans TaxID=1428314 RepID=A0A7W7NXE8_9SPHN|nr:VOC family protein [Novosphingobium chloroacetimidivorans]MBB4860316.1 catechol 2,3-dioxygenase-like lactoylglutathione lyase family enzyme [Novosphingobium chloroacetimidivorans]